MKLYSWDTPNGQKPMLFLEEVSADYEIVAVDILNGEQDGPAFRGVNPNGKIPALEDRGNTIFESGAILLYLAERFGRFLPEEPAARMDALSWTFWQVGGLGPMAGQWGHFSRRDERNPYAEKRYYDEMMRLLDVLEEGLGKDGWLAGGTYTVADMMSWPWVRGVFDILAASGDHSADRFTAIKAWCDAIEGRDSTQRAVEKLQRAIQS